MRLPWFNRIFPVKSHVMPAASPSNSAKSLFESRSSRINRLHEGCGKKFAFIHLSGLLCQPQIDDNFEPWKCEACFRDAGSKVKN